MKKLYKVYVTIDDNGTCFDRLYYVVCPAIEDISIWITAHLNQGCCLRDISSVELLNSYSHLVGKL